MPPLAPKTAPRDPRSARMRALGLVWLLAAAAGCGGPETPKDPSAPNAPSPRAPADARARLDAAWGRVIVLPALSLPFQDRATLALTARTDDGQPVTVEWRTLVVTPGLSPAMPPTQRRGWLPPVGQWSTSPTDPSDPTSPNAPAPPDRDSPESPIRARFAVLTLPPGTLGQGVWITPESSTGRGTRLEVNWLPSSRTLADRADLAFSSPLPPEVAAGALVRAALDAESASPFRRWRAKLARGLLRPSDGTPIPGEELSPLTDRFSDPALEQIASQIEERWTVALALLAEADKAIAARVRTGLLLTAPLGGGAAGASGGQFAPIWTTDQAVLDDLLTGLLAPRATARQRLAAADLYLRTVPEANARVSDDAHALDAKTLAPVVVITATNLTDRPFAASAVWPRSFASADLTPVAARSIARLVMPADADALEPKPATASVVVGDWRGTLRASPIAAAVVPPGLFLGPLVPDLSKDEWLRPPGAVASAVPPIAVTMLRAPSPSPRDRPHSEGWVLYGESAPGATGTLKVWFGPVAAGRPPISVELGVLAAPPSASAQASSAAPASPVEPAPPAPLQARRTFSIPVPPEAVTQGRLILGMDATVLETGVNSPRESHWAWPRAMFPWQAAPSRAALDLTAWGGISAQPSSR